MAKTAKTASKKGKQFKGDLPKIRKAIDKVAKVVVAGRKQAIKQIAKGRKAKPGTPGYDILVANQAALKRADEILAGLRDARTSIANQCCNNDQGCNFLVIASTASLLSR